MPADLRPDRCETCAWWTREPALATGIRRPDGSDASIGCCHLNPPWVVRLAFDQVSKFPEVHAHRFCGEWMTNRTPDGDGGEEVDNVVALRSAA